MPAAWQRQRRDSGTRLEIIGAGAPATTRTTTTAAANDGVGGVNSAAAGSAASTGVVGITAQSGPAAAGIWGENRNGNGTGVIGIANGGGSTVLPNGSGGAFSGNITGVFARSTTAGNGQAIYADQHGEIVRVGYWNGTSSTRSTAPARSRPMSWT